MKKSKVNPIITWWMTPKLPVEHIFISADKRPKGFKKKLRVYVRKWLVHPIKRRIAKYYLLILQRFFGLKVIGITGSAGKTSTKEMAASVLSERGKTIASYKNIDPVYNIPSTILRCTPDTDFLVLEMAVEFKGEMDFYLWLAKPEVGVLTNIFPTHTEFFGDEKGVYDEKVKLIRALPEEGAAILNSENKFVKKAADTTKANVFFYGGSTEIRAKNRKIKKDLTTEYTLVLGKDKKTIQFPLIGDHFIGNSLAAVAIGSYYGLPISKIAKGLTSFKRPAHRMDIREHKSGALVINDSYNNNPSAAKKAVKTLIKIGKNRKKVVIFGDMLELGDLEEKYHKELGSFMAEVGIDYLIGVGDASKQTVSEFKKGRKDDGNTWWVKEAKQVYRVLESLLDNQAAILVKGSRSIRLDKVIDELFS